MSDIEALSCYGGNHETEFGYQRVLSKRFPFCLSYSPSGGVLLVVAVIDARRDPLWIR